MIKVAVTGAQGVGKSAFCESLFMLARHRLDMPVKLLNGMGAKVKKTHHGNVGHEATSTALRDFWREHQNRQPGSGLTIYDRCYADMVAYARMLGFLKGGPSYAESQHELLEKAALNDLRDMHTIFVLPIEGPYTEQQAGSEPEEFRQDIQREIYSFLTDNGIPFNIVLSNRADLALAQLEERL